MNFENSKEYAIQLDQSDPIHKFRHQFHHPELHSGKTIYLCGNSLGLQPITASSYVQQEMEDWAKYGVEGHMQAQHPWMPYHEFLAKPMAKVVGALPDEVVIMNSLSVNLHLLFVSFYRPTKKRFKIVIEKHAFPSDRFVVESQLKFHGIDPAEGLITWEPGSGETFSNDDLKTIIEQEGESIALIFIGGVNYYTGQNFDIKAITSLAHEYGIIAGFDLAHAAGNIPLELHDSGADFAAWCSYKYLNSGPGSLSGIFIHNRHANDFGLPRFAGWWGHNKKTRFLMRDDFDPMPGAEGWQLSNPPILPMACMRASLDLFEQTGMQALNDKTLKLTGYLEYLINENHPESLEIITPSNPKERGCQLSLRIKGGDKRVFDRISEVGVIADWREPDVIRIAPVPLYNSFEDVYDFSNILSDAVKK
jgi:kynureninase